MKNNYKSSKGVSLLIRTLLWALFLFPITVYATAPVVTGLDPLNNETNVNLNQVFSLNFDQNIYPGLAGKKIRLIDVATENILYSVEINSPQISIVGAVLSWTLPEGVLDYSKNYYINMEPAAVKNGAGQHFAGMSYSSWKITTKADNDAPVLVETRPTDGSVGVYEKNELLVFSFNEPIQAGSGSITIKRVDNNAVALSVDVSNSANISLSTYLDTYRFTVIPTNVLDFGTEYYVEVDAGAIEDVLGNSFAGISIGDISFTMRAFVDTDSPLASSFLPADDATNIAIDTELSIVFDEDVQKGTGDIFIKNASGGAIVHTIDVATVTINNNIASFPLPSDLALSTGYFITMVSGVFEDTSGNPFAGFTNSTTWSFTTGSGVDNTPPTVTSLFPINGATEVNAQNIDILFDYFIQKGTGSIYLKDAVTDAVIYSINVASPVVEVLEGSYHLRANVINYTLTNREFYIEMASGVVQDLAGNDFAGFAKGDWQFKTKDTSLPVVINSSPASRSKGVALDATITITANEPLLQPNGGFSIRKLLVEEALNPIEFFSVVPGVPRTGVHYVPAEDITVTGNTVSFDLPGSSIMEEGTMYYISSGGGIIDLVGNESIGIYPSSSYLFKTLSTDVNGPVVTSTNPVDNTIDVAYLPSLNITFDEPIKKTSGNITFFRASDDGVDRLINILSSEVVISGSTMTITPNTTFQPNTEYYVQMGGVVADYQDNPTLGISGTDFSFTTVDPGDVTPPTAISLFPLDNATGVPVGSEFTILFNEEVKLSGAGTLFFRRVSDNATLTSIDVLSEEVSIVGNSLTINPSADIAPNTEFYIQMGGVIQDASDNYFGGYGFEDYAWSFTTAPDVTPPNLVSTYPTYGETDIPIDANFTMLFDESVTRNTLVLLYSASDDEFIQYFFGAEIALEDGNKQVTINPTNDLLPGKEYYIKVSATAFKDGSDNFFTGIPDKDWSFTTAGVASEVIAPTVQSFSPAHLSTTFAATPKLSITFDEPIAAGTGNLRVKDKSNDNIIAVVSISNAVISDATITFDPAVELPADGKNYYVIIDNGAITDLSGNAFTGIANNTTWNFATNDTELPFIISKSPQDGNGEVANSGASFDLTFNENIAEGTGSLSIYTYDNNQLVEEFEMGVSAFYSISNATITLNSQATLDPNTHYYIKVDNGAIEDTSGNLFGGMFNKDDWDFITFGEDVAPLLSGSFSPVDGATSVGISDNLVITFNEDVQASPNGYVLLKYAAGTTREAISLNSANAVFSGNTLTLNPTNDLINGLDFHIIIQAGAITDLAGNDFAGILDATTWNFTAELLPDLTAPFVTTITPYDDQTHIAIDSDFTMYFSENVQKGSGNILIKNFATNATVQTIDVVSGEVTIAGQLVTINPASDLGNLTEYYIEMPSGVFQDLAGNKFAGYAKPDWSFTTIVLVDVTSPSIASLSPIDGATNLNALENFTITFDEPIKKGSGFLQIYDDTDALIQNINSTLSANVTFDEYSVTINPTNALAYGKTYYIVIPSGIIKDLSNNAFSLAKGEWDFSTSATDTHNPNLVTLSPTTGYVDWPRNGSNLFMTFDEVMAAGTGNVYIKRADNDAIAVTKAATSLFNLGQINPWFQSGVLDYGTEYYVEIASGVLTDAAGNPFSGISKGTWHFTIEEDVTPPTALSQGPTNNTTGYGITNNIIVFFNEAVQLGVGTIILRDAASGEVLKTYNESSTEVTIDGGTGLLIDPAAPYLQYETQYSVEIGGNIIQDLAGNPFAGIAEGNWLFTTADRQTQTINFTAMPPRIYGGADFGLIATASSSLPITYEVVEGNISIDGTTVTILGAGNVTIRATQAGDDEYQAAVSVEQSFEITPKAQSITFGSQPSKTFGAAPFALTATVASGLEVEFRVVSGPAILSGNEVIITGVGSVVIAANQPGNENYAAAPEVQRSITVNKAAQSITFNALANKTFDAADFDLYASSTSGLEITYSLIGGPATISGKTVSITGVGTVGIRASQSGDTNYNATGSVDQFFDVTKADQTITFDAIANKTYGDATLNLTASASSNLTVSLVVMSGPASLSGNTLTITGAGDVTVRATQPGDGDYNPASFAEQSFNIVKAELAVIADNKTIAYGDAIPTLTFATTGFVYGENAGAVTEPTASTVANGSSDAGTYDIALSGGVSSNYSFALTNGSLTINKANQIISINAIADKLITDADFNVTATTTSGLTLSYAIQSGPASISGSTVTLDGTAGTVVVEVTQAGNVNYHASSATESFAVNNPALSNQTITFNALANKVYGDADFDLTATASSTLAVSYSVVSGPATISGSTVTITGAGLITIRATQDGDGSFNAATPVEQSFTSAKAALTVLAEDKSNTFGDAVPSLTYTITGYVNGDDATAITTEPSINTLATGGSDAGTYDITLTGGVADNYSFSLINGTLTINKANQTVSIDAIATKLLTDADFNVVANVTSGLALSYAIISGPASITGATITLSGTAGEVVVEATQAGNINYNTASASIAFNVNDPALQDQVITFDVLANKVYGDADFSLTASTDAGLAISYTIISGPATISGNTVSLTGLGSVLIEASQVGNSSYNPAISVQQNFDVTKATLTVTAEDKLISYGEEIPTLTYVYSGFVNNEDATALITEPTISTIATGSSDAGTYDILLTGGTADNYIFELINGVITINKNDQIITFNAIEDQLLEDGSLTLNATSDADLEVSYEITTGNAMVSGNILTFIQPGTVTVKASQVGNETFNAATPVEQTFDVVTVTGIKLGVEKVIQVYPNPAANYIQISEAYEAIRIISTNGVVVYQSADGRNQIDISNFNSGSYIVMLSTKSGTQTIKLLKK